MKNLAYSLPCTDTSILYFPRYNEKTRDIFYEYCRTIPYPDEIHVNMNDITKLKQNDPKVWDGICMYELVEISNNYKKTLLEYVDKIQKTIRIELREADVEEKLLECFPEHSEVPYKVYGEYKHYKFYRGWCYWIVKGDTSHDIAKIIYSDMVGRESIRTNGWAGNRDPSEFCIINTYHIDTQEGLNRFVNIIKQYIV